MGTQYNGFQIDRTENGYRLSRIENSDIHCHLKNKSACYDIVDYVNKNAIPRDKGFYYLSCLCRLTYDDDYRSKVQSLIDVRKQKGKKLQFFNSRKKI